MDKYRYKIETSIDNREKKMLEWWVKNFANCELGDERLNNRAFMIGKILSEGYGKAFSEIFAGGNKLKRAYEFSGTVKLILKR
jgi:hypothetical protein